MRRRSPDQLQRHGPRTEEVPGRFAVYHVQERPRRLQRGGERRFYQVVRGRRSARPADAPPAKLRPRPWARADAGTMAYDALLQSAPQESRRTETALERPARYRRARSAHLLGPLRREGHGRRGSPLARTVSPAGV